MIERIIASFLLPPGIFILLLFLCGIWFLSRRRWKEGFASCVIAIAVWLASTIFFTDVLFRELECSYTIPKSPHGDVILLLGGGISAGAPDFSGIGAPGGEMMTRIVTAVRLQILLGIPVIVSGGAVYQGQTTTEAVVARRFLEDLGVPHKKIIEESKSRDTIENAKYSVEICTQYGFKRPVLVTSAFHMRRAVSAFEKAGMKVLPFPANFRTWRNKVYGWQDFLPVTFEESSIALHEYLGLLFYKLAY
ncbi:MAG: YdcF family protein [Dissulfurispiraceae bacterium]